MVVMDRQGIPGVVGELTELSPGVHACLLYETATERFDNLVGLVRDGIAAGERVLNVDDDAGQVLLDRLGQGGIDGRAAVDRGALVLRSSREVYLPDGVFDPERVRQTFLTARLEAIASGFRGHRSAADVPADVGTDANLDTWIRYEASFDESLAGHGIVVCLYDLTRFSGTAIPAIVRAHPILALGRGPTGPRQVRWLMEQLERLQMRDQEAEALHRATLAIAGELDLDARLERVLDAALEVTGAEHARIMLEVPGTDDVEFAAVRGALGTPPGYRQPRGSAISEVMRRNRPVRTGDVLRDTRTWDPEIVRRMGIRSWLGAPLADDDGVFGVLAVVSDAPDAFTDADELRLSSLAALAGFAIREARLRRQLGDELAERKRAELELFRREQELRAVVETTPDLVSRIDADLRYVYINPAQERLSGIPVEASLGARAGDEHLTPAVGAAYRLAIQQVFETGREQMVEVPANVPGGTRTFEIRIAPQFAANGSVEHVVTVARDVTERWHREQQQMSLYRELLEREDRLRDLVREALLARDQEQRRLGGRRQLEELTRRERDILRLLAQGLTTREIADRLVLSPGTVKSYVSPILHKLEVANRTQAAIRARELGLVDDSAG